MAIFAEFGIGISTVASPNFLVPYYKKKCSRSERLNVQRVWLCASVRTVRTVSGLLNTEKCGAYKKTEVDL